MLNLPQALLDPLMTQHPQAYVFLMSHDQADALKLSMGATGRVKSLWVDETTALVVFSGRVDHWNAIGRVARIGLLPKDRRFSFVVDNVQCFGFPDYSAICLFMVAVAVGALLAWIALAFDLFSMVASATSRALVLAQGATSGVGSSAYYGFQVLLGTIIDALERYRGAIETDCNDWTTALIHPKSLRQINRGPVIIRAGEANEDVVS